MSNVSTGIWRNCVTVPLNFLVLESVCNFIANRKTASFCPCIVIGQLMCHSNHSGGGTPLQKRYYFSQTGYQASYFTPLARLWGTQGLGNVTFRQPRPENKTCFLRGWKTKRNKRLRMTPAYVSYSFSISIGWGSILSFLFLLAQLSR